MRGRGLSAPARLLGAVLLAVVLACCLGVRTARARDRVDETRDGLLSVSYADEETVVAGAKVELRRVASISGFDDFSPVGAYGGYGLDFGPEDARGWRSLAQTLAGYAARDGLAADASVVTDAGGTAVFPDLELGLYLVTSEPAERDGMVCTQEPALVSVPMEDEYGAWSYDAACVLKFEKSPMESVSLRAVKLWLDDEGRARPQSVEVQLVGNSEVVDTQTLSAEGGWSCSWGDLDPAVAWSVVEAEVPEGYAGTVYRSGDTFVVENRATSPAPDPGASVPKTGEPASAAPLALAAGAALCVAARALRRRLGTGGGR